MAKHEFGIMPRAPGHEERFDTYEPELFNCIQVDDDLIEPILGELQGVDCYWHTLQRPAKGLAYDGITLIPPESMDPVIKVLSSYDQDAYAALISLVRRAKEQDKYVIHFGI